MAQEPKIDTPLYSYASVMFLYGAGAYDPGVSQPTSGHYHDFELWTPEGGAFRHVLRAERLDKTQ